MLDPYRMVTINVIASLILLVIFIVVKYVYKKSLSPLFLLLTISILPVISIFRVGVYESGDFTIHIARSMAFYDALLEGNFLPSWAKDLNATHGYPLFIFNYSLPYYIISFFHFLGFSFITSMKIFLTTAFMLSGVTMYFWTKRIYKKSTAAFMAAIFYTFAPYHLIATHFKVTIGEVLTFALLPFAFHCTYLLYKKPRLPIVMLTGFVFSLLILSHAVLGFFSLLLAASFILFLSFGERETLELKNISIAFIIALTISLYSWASPLLLQKYTINDVVPIGTAYFPMLSELLYSPWRQGFLFQGPQGEISLLLGYVHIFILLITLAVIFFKKIPIKIKGQLIFWIVATVLLIFLITAYSKPLWESVPFLKIVGSHRLLIFTSFTMSLLAGYYVLLFNRRVLVFFLVIFAIGTTILNWGHRRVMPDVTDSILKNNLWKSTAEGEGHFYANSKWVDIHNPWFSKHPKQHIEILKGEGKVTNTKRTSTQHIYYVDAKTPLEVRENTLYFPGWEAKHDGKKTTILPDKRGIITFTIPKGTYTLEVLYTDVQAVRMNKLISAVAFIIIIFYLLHKARYIFKTFSQD